MGSEPTIAIIVAALNAGTTVDRSVRSALRQGEVGEVVVVDDASSDDTASLAVGADDGTGRLRIIRLPQNLGPAAARNLAIAETRAELVCVLDADDWLQDGRFGRMLAAADGDWDLLADDLLLASETAPEHPSARMLDFPDGIARTIDLTTFVAANISGARQPRTEMGYLKPLMRRSFLEGAGLKYDERLRLGEDFALYAQALVRGARFMLVPACGYVAVECAGSLSRAHGAAELAALLAADDRLIDEARRLAPVAVPVLQAHRRSIHNKLAHREALAARRAGDWVGAARHLFSSPSATKHILGETVRAKLSLRR